MSCLSDNTELKIDSFDFYRNEIYLYDFEEYQEIMNIKCNLCKLKKEIEFIKENYILIENKDRKYYTYDILRIEKEIKNFKKCICFKNT